MGGDVDNRFGVFDDPFLVGEDDPDELRASDEGWSSGVEGMKKAGEVVIDTDVSIENMLAIFASDKITVESGVTIDGDESCQHQSGVYGQNGEKSGDDWVSHAYTRAVCDDQLMEEMKQSMEFEFGMLGGGVESGPGGAALLLAADVVEIQAPSTITLQGVDENDGHFGVIYDTQFFYDDTANTNGSQVSTTPSVLDINPL
jgi:hypothetical protein